MASTWSVVSSSSGAPAATPSVWNIANALTAYRKGERKHPTMKAIAASLTDQDIADLSAFYSTEAVNVTAPPAKPEREPSAQVAELLKKANCVSCHGDNFSKPIDGRKPRSGFSA